jgi:branched-chain amino acid transport system substrate-binding protein
MRQPLAVFGLTAAIVGSTPSGAQISNEVVKIGVLSDMSSLYSDSTGPGSLIAAQMAAADFNGKVKGKPIEVIGADHQNKPDVGSTSPASGMMPARSMSSSMFRRQWRSPSSRLPERRIAYS